MKHNVVSLRGLFIMRYTQIICMLEEQLFQVDVRNRNIYSILCL